MRIKQAILPLIVLPAVLLSCSKDEEEAAKWERADHETFRRVMSDLSSFRLANGITVYLQEEHTNDQVAIEALYRAGYLKEPKGRPQLAHVSEHLSIHCGSGSFGPGESIKQIKTDGMISAEAVCDFVHVDYIVPKEKLDQALMIESERLKSIRCDEETLEREAKKAAEEIDGVLESTKPTLVKFGMMALNQVLMHGETFVPLRAATGHVAVEDVHRFHDTYYRPDDLILVLIGAFHKEEAEALVRKHFEPIPSRPAPPTPQPTLKRSLRAQWDVPASVVYYVFPGPYESFKDRMILSMFGAYLNRTMSTTESIYMGAQTYASNQVYPVGDLPFFVFAQPVKDRTLAEIAPAVQQHLDRAIAAIDDGLVDALKGSFTSFVNASSLKPDVPDYPVPHHQVIGQEGLNVGIKHILREGRTNEEFTDEINSITAEDVRTVLQKYLARSRMIEVIFEPRRA